MKKFFSTFLATILLSTTVFATPADRLKLPIGVTHFYVNACGAQSGWAAGNDANDGLTQLTPKAHTQTMMMEIANNYDWTGNLAEINPAPNCTDTMGIHFAPHAMVGAQGGAALKIKGSTGSAIIPTSGTAVDIFNGGIIQLETIKVGSPNAAGIGATVGGRVYLMDGVELASAPGGRISIGPRGSVALSGNVTISGDAFATILMGGGGAFDGGGSFKFLTNATHSGAFAYVTMNSTAHFGGITIDMNGKTVTGTKWLSWANSSIIVPTGNGDTFFPGSVNGSANYNGICY